MSTEVISPINPDEIKYTTKTVNSKLPAHRFIINQSGSIRQYSPISYNSAFKQYEIFIENIKTFMEINAETFDKQTV